MLCLYYFGENVTLHTCMHKSLTPFVREIKMKTPGIQSRRINALFTECGGVWFQHIEYVEKNIQKSYSYAINVKS